MISAGDRIPEIELTCLTPDGPEKVSSFKFFGGRRVLLFAVPAAFSPTCSARHLPGFVDLADEIRAKGVDLIAATAVNDHFVMEAWGRTADTGDKIVLLPDGNADFATALGLTVDARRFSMGIRSERYAMIVNDGIVERLDVEQPGAFEVSSAEFALSKL